MSFRACLYQRLLINSSDIYMDLVTISINHSVPRSISQSVSNLLPQRQKSVQQFMIITIPQTDSGCKKFPFLAQKKTMLRMYVYCITNT
jgi:hypothetical protein